MNNAMKPLQTFLKQGFRAGAAGLAALLCGGLAFNSATAEEAIREPESAGGPAVMRRLTESQYRATIADIFGPEVPIVGRFEPGLRAEGLIAVGTSESGISPFSIEQYDASAQGIAAAVTGEELRDALVTCKPPAESTFDAACAEKFVTHYGKLLFRRPMTATETERYVEAARSGHQRLDNFYSGLGVALSGMLVSPKFLLRIEQVEPDPDNPDQYRLDSWSKATRLSYFLTNSAPDEELLRAAAAGELDTEEGIEQQVERLMASPRFENAVRAFFDDMMEFALFDDLSKDPILYPAFNSTVAKDAREQTLRTVLYHLLEQNGDYRELFTTRAAPLTRALGTVYRMPVASRNGWEIKEFSESSRRAGILSHVSFLALHSHPGRSSPTLRGMAIREVFMCQPVPDPPADVNFMNFSDENNETKLTARDRLEAHRTQPVCAGCHVLMDPLGLPLENFDGVGGFRTKENGVVIDVSGGLDGKEFEAASGLGKALSQHPETTRCLVSKLYRSAVGRKTAPGEWPYLEYLNKEFAAGDYRLPALIRTIALSDTFYTTTTLGEKKDSVAVSQDNGDQL